MWCTFTIMKLNWFANCIGGMSLIKSRPRLDAECERTTRSDKIGRCKRLLPDVELPIVYAVNGEALLGLISQTERKKPIFACVIGLMRLAKKSVIGVLRLNIQISQRGKHDFANLHPS